MSLKLLAISIVLWATFPILFIQLFLVYYSYWIRLVILGYWAWVLFIDKSQYDGSRKGRLKDWINWMMLTKHVAEYLNLKLIKEPGWDNEQKSTNNGIQYNGPYLFVLHPHGVLGYSHFTNFASNVTGFNHLFPDLHIKLGTLNLNLLIPIVREVLLSRGFVSVDRHTINTILSTNRLHGNQNNAMAIVVGGAKESFLAEPGRNTIYLKQRKGFIKTALENGASLVPIYSFGENYLYHQVRHPMLTKLQQLLTKWLSFAPLIFYGRFYLPFFPNGHPVTTVVGDPILVKKTKNPTKQQIDDLHELYCIKLTELFNKYKEEYDPNRAEDLIIH